MNFLQYGRHGGGNVGFAIDAFVALSIAQCADRAGHVGLDGAQEQLVDHTITEWKKSTSDKTRYCVRLLSHPPSHVGLGTSAALQSAVLFGINFLNGSRFASDELLGKLALSYREYIDGSLQKAFSTGLTSQLGLQGGFAVLDVDGKKVLQCKVPEWSYALAISTEHSRCSYGDSELRIVHSGGKQSDRLQRDEKRKLVFELIGPAICRRELLTAGTAIHELQMLGSKAVEIALHGKGLLKILRSLRDCGVECAFMSAVGPGIASVTLKPTDELLTINEALGLQVIVSGKINNSGIEIVTGELDGRSL